MTRRAGWSARAVLGRKRPVRRSLLCWLLGHRYVALDAWKRKSGRWVYQLECQRCWIWENTPTLPKGVHYTSEQVEHTTTEDTLRLLETAGLPR